jgi:hypothetical protein
MANPVQKRPEGFHTVNPYLVVNGAAKVMEFLGDTAVSGVADRFINDILVSKTPHVDLDITTSPMPRLSSCIQRRRKRNSQPSASSSFLG